jgi:PAS domain S-box-containing protein
MSINNGGDMESELASENKQKRTFERFRDLVEGLNSKYFLFAIDPEGSITYLSPSFTKLVGHSHEAQIGRTFYDLIDTKHPLNHDITEGGIFHEKNSTEEAKCIRALQSTDGTARLFELQTYALNDEAGQLIENKGIARDVTDEFRSVSILKSQIEALKKDNEDKSASLSQAARTSAVSNMAVTICHDICNPLYAIQNYASAISQYLARPDGSLATINLLARDIFRATQEASKIIKYIRPSKRTTIERVSVPVMDLLVDAMDSLEPEIKSYGVQKSININDLSMQTRVDRDQIRQVLINLIAHKIDSLAQLPVEERKIKLDVLAINNDVEIIISKDSGEPQRHMEISDNAEVANNSPSPTELSVLFCRAIIEANGGKLGHLPSASQGISFHILLPRIVA